MACLRFMYVIFKITTGHNRKSSVRRTTPSSVLICLGSGGHTTEMLKLIQPLNFTRYNPRYYVIANDDTNSLAQLRQLETYKRCELQHAYDDVPEITHQILPIPRCRKVNQSFFTSIFTTLNATLYCFYVIVYTLPDLILCNGPGTCIPVCFVAFFLKLTGVKDIRIVFVESFCRTRTFSLSGKIMTYFADNFIVQWPTLKKKLKRSEYIGQLL